MDSIFNYLILGFFLHIVIVVTSIELYHYRNEDEGSVPTFKGIVAASIAYSLIVLRILFEIADHSGESGFGIIFFIIPLVFIGYNIGGVLVGLYYRNIGRTIIKSRRKVTPKSKS